MTSRLVVPYENWIELWNILEEIDAQLDLEDELGKKFYKRVKKALWEQDDL